MKIFKLVSIFVISAFIMALSACEQKKEAANQIRVGTIAGPETQLMEVAKQVAAKQGLDIQIVQFSDYTMPNEALADGSIDANMFQHLPYLNAAIKAKNYPLIPVAKTFVYPMAIYSKKIKNIADLNSGATVAIPNDPSNEARALLLLEKAKLITLKPDTSITATTTDIASNPKNLNIEAIDAAQLPRVLPDVELAVINTNYAMIAGLVPSRDGLIVEDANSPYANLIVIRANEKNDPRIPKLIAAFQSPEVLQKAKELFKGQAIAAWK